MTAKEDKKEREALRALLAKYGPERDYWTDADRALRAARGLSRIAERQCSEDMPDAEIARVEKREKSLERSIERTLCPYGAKVTFEGDPRGFVVKLHFAPRAGLPYDGRKPSNTFGGEESGYGIG